MNTASDIWAVGNKVEIVLIKGDKEKIFNSSVEIVKRTPKRFVVSTGERFAPESYGMPIAAKCGTYYVFARPVK